MTDVTMSLLLRRGKQLSDSEWRALDAKVGSSDA